jgi:RimJ/RimL family protein N-acetyltransferase
MLVKVTLQGERLLLRPLRGDELDVLYQGLLASPDRVGEPSRERLRVRIARSGRWVEGRLDLGIEAERRLVGSIDARAPAGAMPPGVCEIGLELFDGERGWGLGTEALALFAAHLVGTGFARVQASTAVDNAPMRRVLEKLGFVYEGTMRSFMPDGEGRADYVLFALTR